VVVGARAIASGDWVPILAYRAAADRRHRDARRGLTWNDLIDRDIDARVERRARGHSVGQVSVKAAWSSSWRRR